MFLYYTCRPTPVPSPSEHGETVPSPIPSASESSQSSLTRPISRRSTPRTPFQADLVELWVEAKATSSPMEETTNYDSFDVYIDEVRFLPDNATIIKVIDLREFHHYNNLFDTA